MLGHTRNRIAIVIALALTVLTTGLVVATPASAAPINGPATEIASAPADESDRPECTVAGWPVQCEIVIGWCELLEEVECPWERSTQGVLIDVDLGSLPDDYCLLRTFPLPCGGIEGCKEIPEPGCPDPGPEGDTGDRRIGLAAYTPGPLEVGNTCSVSYGRWVEKVPCEFVARG